MLSFSSICPFFHSLSRVASLLPFMITSEWSLVFSPLNPPPPLLYHVLGHCSSSSLHLFSLFTFLHIPFLSFHSYLFFISSCIPFPTISPHLLISSFSFFSYLFPPSPRSSPLSLPPPLPPPLSPPPPPLSSASPAKTKTIRPRKTIRKAGSALCSVVRGSSLAQKRIRFVFSQEPILFPFENYDRLSLRLVGLHATSEGNPIPCPVNTSLTSLRFPLSLYFPSLPFPSLPLPSRVSLFFPRVRIKRDGRVKQG